MAERRTLLAPLLCAVFGSPTWRGVIGRPWSALAPEDLDRWRILADRVLSITDRMQSDYPAPVLAMWTFTSSSEGFSTLLVGTIADMLAEIDHARRQRSTRNPKVELVRAATDGEAATYAHEGSFWVVPMPSAGVKILA